MDPELRDIAFGLGGRVVLPLHNLIRSGGSRCFYALVFLRSLAYFVFPWLHLFHLLFASLSHIGALGSPFWAFLLHLVLD